MRIALVSPYDLGAPGGVQSHVLRLAAALRAAGDEVVVVGPGEGRGSRDGYVGTGRSMRVPFNGSVAPIGIRPSSGVRTRQVLSRIAPDVIHVHEPLVPVVGLAAATSRIAPVVATFHAWSSSDRAYRLVRPAARRVVGRLADALAVSRAAAEYHAAALGVPTEQFVIVPNGVDAARFAAAPDDDRDIGAGDASVEESLLFVGRLEPRKGLATLIRAFVALREQRPALRLDVVGDGPEGQRCRRSVPERWRADVRFHGRLDDDDLVRRFARARVYVSPALGGESFGIVLLEAMAAGTPVVASDIPGYASVVRSGHDAVLVAPGDAPALAAAIGALLDDPARRADMIVAGHRTVAAHDWPVVAGRVREHYQRALDAV